MRGVLLLLLLLAHAPAAHSEVCTAGGQHAWIAVDDGGFACDESGDDRFVLDSADDLVTLHDDIVLTTGSITCSAGSLVIEPGVTLTWTGPDDATQEILVEDACLFVMQGQVLWEGRLESVAWGGGATSLETRLGLPENVAASVAPGHSVHFAWDDLEPIGQEIRRPIQTQAGAPSPGVLHPSYAVGQFLRIAAVGTGSQNHVDVFHSTEQDLDLLDGVLDGSPAFGPPGISGPATSSYVGTRALVTGVVPSGLTLEKHRMYTRITVPGSVGVVDSDFGSRYVTWEAGSCAGERWKVVGFEDDHDGQDVVIVAGDASACGPSPFALTWGAGAGDLVRIVDRPVVDGNNVAHIRVRGGELQWRYPRLVRLDKVQTIAETPSVRGRCALCFYQESETSQIAAGSTIDHLELAYTQDDFEGTFLVSLISGRENGVAGENEWTRRFDDLLDFCEVSTRGWWIHDEHIKDPEADGTHGLRLQAGCARFEGLRIERVSDDALFVFTSHLGTERPRLTVSLPILYENLGEGDTTQECLTMHTGYHGDGDDHAIVDPEIEIRDPLTIGCEIAWIDSGVGHTFDRGLIGTILMEDTTPGFGGHLALNYAGVGPGPATSCAAPGLPSPCCTGNGTGSCAWPERAIERFPNVVSNTILFPLVADGLADLYQRVGGELRRSVVAPSNAENHMLRNLFGAMGSFVSLRGSNPNKMRSFGGIFVSPGNADVTNADSLDYGPDLVVINEYEGSTDLLCGTDYDAIGLESLEIERFFYLGNDSQSGGWLQSCAATSNLAVNADGFLISARLDGQGNGKGLGQGALTDDGATIQSACIETRPAVAPESPLGFGPNLTPLSFHLSPFEPDSDDDLQLREYANWGEGESAQCQGPRQVGIGRLGAAHVLGLGEGALRQLDLFSTADLPRVLAGELDQLHDPAPNLSRAIHQSLEQAQGFSAGLAGRLTAVEVDVSRDPSTTEPLIVEIHTAAAGLPSGTILASVSVPASDVGTTSEFMTVGVSAFDVRSAPGEALALVLRSDSEVGAGYAWAGVADGRYAAGTSSRKADAGPWEPDSSSPDADLDFRTFADPAFPPAANASDCGDHVDNDADGLADLMDPGCSTLSSSPEDPACNDGIDNDGDGGIDFDGAGVANADPQCSAGSWPTEGAVISGCGLGVELALLLPILFLGRHRSRAMRAKATRSS